MSEDVFWGFMVLVMISIGIILGWHRHIRPYHPKSDLLAHMQHRAWVKNYEKTHLREEPGYDYRMIIASYPDAEGRRQEVEILAYQEGMGEWPLSGQTIRNMSREEFDGYLHSLSVNGWEPTGPENGGPPTTTYYRRSSDHPLRRG
jgi:hypothetical protein